MHHLVCEQLDWARSLIKEPVTDEPFLRTSRKSLTLTLRDTLYIGVSGNDWRMTMFLTGEFSQISRVSKRLLHYYDEIGLLKPAHIDPHTGYRYYSASQLPRLNRILALKDLGLALDHIARMMQAEVSDEEIHGMLLMKKAELEQTLREDVQRLRGIEARIQQNQMADDALDVVIKSIPAQLFLSIRAILPSPEEMLQLVQQVQRILPSRVDQRILGPFAGIVYTDGFALMNNDVEFGYLLKKP